MANDKNTFNKLNAKSEFIDKPIGILLFLAAVIIPLIVRIRIVPVSKYESAVRAAKSINDMFSYNKAVAVCVVAACVIAYLLLGVLLEEKRLKLKLKSFPCYLIYGYIGLCLISTLFSKYIGVALWGASERYEGFFVLLSYGVLFVTALSFAATERAVKWMMIVFALGALCIGVIGAMQTFGFDIFATDTGSSLVLGQYYTKGNNLELKFGSAYATLYNPNCLGMYAGMMAAFTIIPTVMLPLKSKIKYGFAVVFALSAICMFGSDSVGGFLGFGCACVMALIAAAVMFVTKKLYKNPVLLTSLLASVAVVVVLIGVMFATDNVIASKIRIIADAVSGKTELANANFYEDITFDGYKATIVTKAGNIEIDAKSEVPVVSQNGTVREAVNVTSTPYEGVSEEVKLYTYNIDGIKKGELQVHGDKVQFKGYDDEDTTTMFIMQRSENGLEMLDKFGQTIDKEIEWYGFEGIESLGSNRGYIWSRSIPLLKQNIIIGKGPDTFAMEFPQNDVVAKLRCFGNPYIIVDKPHNIYLQTAINTGMLSLIAMLVLVIFYIGQTVARLAKRSDGIFVDSVRLACVCAVVAYMAAGATTDSVVSVAPVFWMILGTGYGANFITSREEKYGEA
jgi:hypothetical protein